MFKMSYSKYTTMDYSAYICIAEIRSKRKVLGGFFYAVYFNRMKSVIFSCAKYHSQFLKGFDIK